MKVFKLKPTDAAFEFFNDFKRSRTDPDVNISHHFNRAAQTHDHIKNVLKYFEFSCLTDLQFSQRQSILT